MDQVEEQMKKQAEEKRNQVDQTTFPVFFRSRNRTEAASCLRGMVVHRGWMYLWALWV
jgi:hypothetical protein